MSVRIECKDCGKRTERVGMRQLYCPRCKRLRDLAYGARYRARPVVRERARVYARERAKRKREEEEEAVLK